MKKSEEKVQSTTGDNIQSQVKESTLPARKVSVDPKTAENASTDLAKQAVKTEEKHQEALKRQDPVGIDYTDGNIREETLEEHREQQKADWDDKISK